MPTKQKTLQAIDDSIQNWEKRRACVKNKIENGYGNSRIFIYEMEKIIGKDWYSCDFKLCALFHYDNNSKCIDCPLAKIGESCEEEGSVWCLTEDSESYIEWFTASDKMMDALNRARQWVIDNVDDTGKANDK